VTEYYVIDTRTGLIVNCITTSQPKDEIDLSGFENSERLRLDANPPQRLIEKYNYWDGRP
jgi:hypothetical protein